MPRRDTLGVLLLLIVVTLGCIGLWALIDAVELLLAALAAGLAIVNLAIYGR